MDVSAIVIQRNVFIDPRYFEDWKVGDRIETLGRTVGDAEISQFVALGGFFEELFMNSEYVAQQSLYPKRFAPGALIFSFTEGLIIMSGCIHGVGLALVSVDEMTFKRPLFAAGRVHRAIRKKWSRASTWLTYSGPTFLGPSESPTLGETSLGGSNAKSSP